MRDQSEPVGWCREWRGSMNHKYGAVSAGGSGRQWPAHRIAWELAHGPVPDGLFVLHHCDNPPCIKTEPDERYPEGHLYLGTAKDNARDREVRGRAAPRTLYGNAKLTREARDLIRSIPKGARGSSGALALAKRFGCTPGAIRAIRNGSTWRIDSI